MKISMKIAFILGPRIISSTVVYGGDISDLHFFAALNDKFEAKYFHSSFFTPHQIF